MKLFESGVVGIVHITPPISSSAAPAAAIKRISIVRMPANQFFANPAADLRPGFFPSPGLSMTLDGVHVVTHQVSVSFPLR